MLELGQPMHGFDFDKLVGGIEVRNAVEGEKLKLLNDNDIRLNTDTLVIADHEKALALAGIMGGVDSSVTDNTQNIYLESAFFLPEKIMGKARNYGLHTDSSHRFERGVSPDGQLQALERATQLIIDTCGGKPGAVTDCTTTGLLTERDVIRFEKYRIKRHLGINVENHRVVDILTRLGCTVENTQTENDETSWNVKPPIFRFDLATPEDLVEEVARIYGYDNIPARLRPMEPRISRREETRVNENTLRNILVSRGYQEAITYSFVSPDVEALLSPDQEQIRLSNPISEDLSIMRSTLWSGLIPALDKNVKRQQSRIRFFETGLSFQKTADGLEQRKKLAGAITGSLHSEQWCVTTRDVDFYDIKGDVEALLAEATGQDFKFVKSDHSALHPGQSANIFSGEHLVGVCGAIHPAIQKKLNLDQQVFVFELDIDSFLLKKLPEYKKISPYPSTRRDLALLVDQDVDFANITNVLKNIRIKELVDFFLFDVYSGEHIDSGQKSLALGLIFQDFSRTLEEQEISAHVEKIMVALENQTGAVLRQ
jgi:phenylalanyl-tRNA synthetase beta chain